MNKVLSFLKSARSAEVALMIGFPITGALVAFDSVSDLFTVDLLLFILGVFFLCSAVYSFNGWAGMAEDEKNIRLSALKGKRKFFLFSLIIFIVSFIIIFSLLSSFLVISSIVSFFLWMVYSFPKKGFKYKPVLGTLIHFVGQILHFEMGYSVIKETDSFSLLVSIYFALLFSAGHINHELIDYEADKEAGTQTGAVYFGKKAWTYVSFILFSGATLFLLWTSVTKTINIIIFFPFIAAGFIHVARKLMTYRYDFSRERFLSERSFYRFAYFVAGVLFVVIKGLMTV